MARSARALVVELVADVKDFVKGTQTADDALADFVRDSEADLDRLARSSKDATDDMGRQFSNLAREAKQSFDKINLDDVDVDTHDVKEKFADTGKELGGEFAMNLGSALSSGDTRAVVTDSLGGVIGPLAMAGPIGLATASGAAIALGLWNKFSQEGEKAKQRALDLIASVFNEADQLAQDQARQQEALKLFGDDAVSQQQEILRLSQLTGLSQQDILDIVTGTSDKQGELNGKLDTMSREVYDNNTGFTGITEKAQAATDILSKANENTKTWGASIGTVVSQIASGAASLDTINNFQKLTLVDPVNLQQTMAVINGWKNLQDKKVVLDIVTSQEDERRLRSLQGVQRTGS